MPNTERCSIPLKNRHGEVIGKAMVDPEDLEYLSQWTWRLSSEGYAVRGYVDRGRRRTEYMHRLLCDPPPGFVVDHINRDRLDNRRGNLRAVTASENNLNAKDRQRRSRSRGVYWHNKARKWYAQGSWAGVRKHLGLFETEEEAAQAYHRFRQLRLMLAGRLDSQPT
jgi:hypothetical protein